MAGYEQQARLLRTWRVKVAGLTQRQVAEGIPISTSSISMWEHAEREITFEHLEALDRFYSAGGALEGIALAMGTPSGLPPRSIWAHNPQGGSSPVWAWCRPQPDTRHITARVRWGAFAFDCSSPCDEQGVFLTSPVSTPNPPVWVDLRECEPGWVDFGRGEIPDQLGIPTFDALSGLRVATGGHTPAGLVTPHLVSRFITDSAFAEAVLEFFGESSDVVREVFSADDARKLIADLTNRPPPTDTSRPLTGNQWRQLRGARCLSQAEAASLATDLRPESPVTDDQIRGLENGARPRPRYLRARLDQVYRADGYTGTEPVSATSTRPFIFDFPEWWIGPIWFTFASSHQAPAEVELRSGHACKRILLTDGTTVTCRKPSTEPVPFKVICPRGWTVTAGMGTRLDACDVNWGWFNLEDYNSREDDDVHPLFLELFGRTKEEFTQFLLRYEERSAQ